MKLTEGIIDKVKLQAANGGLLVTDELAVQMARTVSTIYFVIHLMLFTMFYLCKVMPMAAFNVLSILFYGYYALTMNIKKSPRFIYYAYYEVIIHMSLAVFFVGWDAGFQITLIGIVIMLFLSEYVGRVLGQNLFPSMRPAIICGVMYIALLLKDFFYGAPYKLPRMLELWLHIIWAVIVFSIITICVKAFVALAFSTETFFHGQAMHDNLTGLENRYMMAERIEKIREERGLEGCWVAMMDIDDFKAVNDTYGHLFGDYVLRTIAEIMNAHRVDAEICRWGGEEFLIGGFTDNDMDIHLARLDDLRRSIEEYEFSYRGDSARITVTMGVAEYRKGMTTDEWVAEADRKLYEGKRSGKNRIIF